MKKERRAANRPGRPAMQVDEAVLQLVAMQRKSGLSFAEIGAQLGCSKQKAQRLFRQAVRKSSKTRPHVAGAEHPGFAEDGSAPASQTPTDAVSMIAAGVDGIGRRLDRAEVLLASAQACADRAAVADVALARLDEQLARTQAGLEQHAARLHHRDALQTSLGEGLARQTEALAETRHCLEHHNALLQGALDALATLPANGVMA